MISQRSRDALEMLRQASDEEKNEIRETILSEYHDLEDALLGGFTKLIEENRETALNTIKQLADIGKANVKGAASTVTEHIATRPWRYLAGCAAAGITLGYFMARPRLTS